MPLLESRINDRCTAVIDCEAAGGIDKGALSVVSHPDKVVPMAMEVIRGIAAELGEALHVDAIRPPSGMTVAFSIKVDPNAVVQIARSHEQGQFKVTLEWR